MLHLHAQYPDGGKVSYWVQSLLQGDLREHDQYTQYLNDETQEWWLIPYQCTAPRFSGEIIDDNGNTVLASQTHIF